MGDHRAQCKIEFTFHGKTERLDLDVNWDDIEGPIDPRVAKFFSDAIKAGHERYRKANSEDDEQREYKRLKAKFEQGGR